ncbi:MAG: aspartate aminotransferase family protein [Rhizobacter sp.]|nr:aspartate aminotransferase family protein [Ferruginibacter sp.]
MTQNRKNAIDISGEEFRKIGYQLIDDIAVFIDSIPVRPVTPGTSTKELQKLLGDVKLPDGGEPPTALLSRATGLLFNHSLLNGHPKFQGYITSSAAPLGALADLLVSAVNPNVGAQILSPIATAIEKQTVKWLTEFIGVSSSWAGLFVSGGNMANFTAFLAARTVKAAKAIREQGISNEQMKMTVYCATNTHAWVEKAAILFGLGTNAIRWIETDPDHKMNNAVLEQTITNDLQNGHRPLMVIGNAGDVSTGAVDDLKAIATICKKFDLWFHIDGAYGIAAAVIPALKKMFDGIEDADSIAIDPHKWLYSPLEAGCTLVKNPDHLLETFSHQPKYYNFGGTEEYRAHNYYEYGFQNSRGFKALKVWLVLQQVGRNGYIKMIGEDIQLAEFLFFLAGKHQELEVVTQHLSITTLRYIPPDKRPASHGDEAYLDKLNEALVNELQQQGELFVSNAIVNNKYCLRSCIVNFRTGREDIVEMIEIIVKSGRKIHAEMKLQALKMTNRGV